jgi:hypothetical protein
MTILKLFQTFFVCSYLCLAFVYYTTEFDFSEHLHPIIVFSGMEPTQNGSVSGAMTFSMTGLGTTILSITVPNAVLLSVIILGVVTLSVVAPGGVALPTDIRLG